MSLFISLYEEETVHLVITALPNLIFLNGIEIHRADSLKINENGGSSNSLTSKNVSHPSPSR
jgi:hypothetical protein